MELRFPHASRSTHIPFILPSISDAYFWLVVVWNIIDRQPPKAKAPPISLFLLLFRLVTPNYGTTPPRSHLLINVPSIPATDSQLIVMSCRLTVTT
jgi:hypothetical protein